MLYFNVFFYVHRSKKSIGSDKKMKISPIYPIVKFAHFGNVR